MDADEPIDPLLDLHPDSPWRRPDWRWLRAGQLQHEGRRPSRSDDAWTRRSLRYRRAVDRHGNPTGRSPGRIDPTIHEARCIQAGLARTRSWELEARLLTGQSPATIAPAFGASPATVEAYAALFFDVADLLDAPDAIALIVLPGLHLDRRIQDPGLLARAYGYFGGPLLLEQVLAVLDRIGDPGAGPGADPPPPDGLENLVELAIAARSLPDDPATALALLRLGKAFAEVERRMAWGAASPLLQPLTVSPGFLLRSTAPASLAPATSSPISTDPRGDGQLDGGPTSPDGGSAIAGKVEAVSLPGHRRAATPAARSRAVG
ncbi:hypothetical protein [Tautonia plasticadhaerens]|uniref:Uncharacterized protein n=1 Tax=Tautonia plasticadhaerens TaxID=2527974 RepID=A0A518H9A7_9BACT|nr:hypothetical protein [Tautonia plasticadhaerens]QDV37429.1 hypothetical protein ElP_53680 [Tautonia plasticadhaerens]